MLVIVGAGGHASDVADLAIRCGIQPAGALADTSPERDRLGSRRVPILGGVGDCPDEATWTFGIGYPAPRAKVAGLLSARPHGPLVDPTAVASPTAELAEGVQIFWQAAVSPLVTIERHALVSYGATIGHDTTIGRFSTIMPGVRISGDASIGQQVLVGTGAVVLQGLTIGDGARIGAGAVVTDHVSPDSTVVGVPARQR